MFANFDRSSGSGFAKCSSSFRRTSLRGFPTFGFGRLPVLLSVLSSSTPTISGAPHCLGQFAHPHLPGAGSRITTLNVGQQTAKDIVDPSDEIVVIKSGQVEVTINGVASRMNESSLMYSAPNDKRTLRDIGSTRNLVPGHERHLGQIAKGHHQLTSSFFINAVQDYPQRDT
jgi:hypothetical protein